MPFVVLILLEAFNAFIKKSFSMVHIIIAAIIFATGLISPIAWFVYETSLKPFAVVHVIVTLILAVLYVYKTAKQK